MTVDLLERQADEAAASGNFAAARALLQAATEAAPGNLSLWIKLAAMARGMRDTPAALAALDTALALDPLDFTALLMRATVLNDQGDVDGAGRAYGRALAQAPEPAPPQLQPVLDAARQRYGLWQERQAEHLRSALPETVSLTPAIERFISNIVRLTKGDRDGPTHYCYPDLPEIAFHDRQAFPWLSKLEALTDVIQAEFAAVMSAEAAELVPYIQYPENAPLEQWAALNQNRNWTAIHLIERGRRVERNARQCPQTMAALDALPQPDIPGAGPNAMFSLLAPGTHIPPHTGVTNTRLVCHVPLIVPPHCWFRVGDERRDWQRGEGWVFDDTVEHEAMNPSERLRVILIVDVWHPALTAAERSAVAAIIGAGGQVHGL